MRQGKRVVLVIMSCVVIATASADADDRAESAHEFVSRKDELFGFYIGDKCVLGCSDHLQYAFCNSSTSNCECDEVHPIVIDRVACAEPKHLGEKCLYTESCTFHDPNSHCVQSRASGFDSDRCQCKDGYYSVISAQKKWSVCSAGSSFFNADVPTMVGVATIFIIASGLLCFLFRTYSCWSCSLKCDSKEGSAGESNRDSEIPTIFRRNCSLCKCQESHYCECTNFDWGDGLRAPPPTPICDTEI